MSLRFLAGAEQDYLGALRYYRAIDAGLAERFARRIDERLERASVLPGVGRVEPAMPKRFDLRWYVVRRFPYSLLVGTLHGERVVVALAHDKRRPGYWLERLEK